MSVKRILVELALAMVLVGIALVDIHTGQCGLVFGSMTSGYREEWSVRQIDSPVLFSSCVWYTFAGAVVCFVFALLDALFALVGDGDS
jgi:hypothetical protein